MVSVGSVIEGLPESAPLKLGDKPSAATELHARVEKGICRLLSLEDLQLAVVLKAIRQETEVLLDGWRAKVCIRDCGGAGWVTAYRDGAEGPASVPQEMAKCNQCYETSLRRVPAQGETEFFHFTRIGCFFRIPIRGRSFDLANAPCELGVCASACTTASETSCSISESIAAFRAEFNNYVRVAMLILNEALRDEQQFFLQCAAKVAAAGESAREETMNQLANDIKKRMRYEACTILLYAADTCVLHVIGTAPVQPTKAFTQPRFRAAKFPRDPAVQACEKRHPITSNNMLADDLLDAVPANVSPRTLQQVLAIPIFAGPACSPDATERPIIGVIVLRNKTDDDNYQNRPIDALDLLEGGLAAASTSPVLSMLTAERLRADRIMQMRHDMYDPILTIRDIVDRYAVHGPEWIADHAGEIKAKLRNINGLTDILYSQVVAARAISYSDVDYDLERTSLPRILRTLAELFDTECKRAHLEGVFVKDISAIPTPLYVDRKMIQVALFNIYKNAIKYSDKQQRVWINGSLEDERCCISVSNFGIGIDPEDRERVFEKWYRATKALDRSKRGLGLGLFIAREIARAHGGEVEVTRCADPTTVTLKLPLWLTDEEKARRRVIAGGMRNAGFAH